MQRRMNLKRIRSIKLPSRKIYVFRDDEVERDSQSSSKRGSGKQRKNKSNFIPGSWKIIDSKELVPGDICAIRFTANKK